MTPEKATETAATLYAAMCVAQEVRDYATYHALRYSTLMLEASVTLGDLGPAGAPHPRQAAVLLRLETADQRRDAMDEACTRQNLQGGVLSAVLHAVVGDLLAVRDTDHPDSWAWGRAAAERHRRDEKALNDSLRAAGYTGDRVVTYPPEMRRS